jgi:Flp pilus assembly protein TadG
MKPISCRRGGVSLLFATVLFPLLLSLGIGVDVSFYIQAQAELDLAADVAAMHAARAMTRAASNGTTYANAGILAGQQWFAAQAEQVPGVTLTGQGTPLPVTVTVSYAPPTYTATVSYAGRLNTFFGRMAGMGWWPIAGTATSSARNNFVDIAMLLDASPSMWMRDRAAVRPAEPRFGLVQSAARQVIQAMIDYSPPPQTLFGIGLYTFSSDLQPLYPCRSASFCATPFGSSLNTALADLSTCATGQAGLCLSMPVAPAGDDAADFPSVFMQAARFLAGTAGNGATPATAYKNLFIVTSGRSFPDQDGVPGAGPIGLLVADPCQGLKDQGMTVYVLYTPTLMGPAQPAADPKYLASPIAAALQACASRPAYFHYATDAAGINSAMQSMLATALNPAGRLTH